MSEPALARSQTTPERPCLALVAMPWSKKDCPSAALASLVAYVRQQRPEYQVASYHEFLRVGQALGFAFYDVVADKSPYSMGELLYLVQLYPEKLLELRTYFSTWANRHLAKLPFAEEPGAERDWPAFFDQVVATLDEHLAALAESLAANHNFIGMTTCFGQLFANVLLAKKVKTLAPGVRVALGGSTVSARVGPSIMGEYPWLDYVIQGEGEKPLVALLDALAEGRSASELKGIVSRENYANRAQGAPLWEVEHLDDLPMPEFDEYVALVDEFGISWALPIEASRGCWWDRTKRTGNPKDTCYFCNLNVQWGGYREKSVPRVAGEIAYLSERYQNLRANFLDNIIRYAGALDLAVAIKSQGKDYEIFHEMRVSIRPYELVALWEAGVETTQFGIEGLSTSYLKRIGKGTTLIQNLQVMKLCYELKIDNLANLIIDFPGATQAEVDETRENLLSYAVAYQPLAACRFHLGIDSTVDAQGDAFGIARVRNSDLYKIAMPEEVWHRLRLFDLDFDLVTPGVDWSPVLEAVEAWRALHEGRREPLLRYRDGRSFITIIDERRGQHREGNFRGLARDVYMFCMETRSFDGIAARFCNATGVGTDDIHAILNEFIQERLIFKERDQYLALAVATRPEIAVHRIRQAAREKTMFAQILVQATRQEEVEEVAGFGTAGPSVSPSLTQPSPRGTRLRIPLPTKPGGA